jgi:NTP pyrophosphatase (non-canonical NTP hydrolase)/Zn finger protein HypA/HybF involved in hydrogenase expression
MLNKLNEFQENSRKTAANLSPLDAIGIYGLGTWTESGEVGDLIKKFIAHGHPLDLVDLRREVGDCLWYVSRVCDFLQVKLGVIWDDANTLDITDSVIHSESRFTIVEHASLDCLKTMAASSAHIFWHARELNKVVSCGRHWGANLSINISLNKEKIFEGLKALVVGLKSLLAIYHVDILEVLEINQKKLKARYEGGFSAEASMERVDTKEQATCPDCHKPITSGEQFVFKKCFKCASGTKKEAADNSKIFNKILDLCLNSHMTAKEYEALQELMSRKPTQKIKTNNVRCFDCEKFFSIEHLFFVDGERYCKKCLKEMAKDL